MINHYLTIAKVANELQNNCIGSQLIRCFSFRKNEFLFSFSNQKQFSVFLVPSKPFIFISKPDQVPAKNVYHFFRELTGLKLTGVLIHANDRILKLNFENEISVILRIFSASSGIVLYRNSEFAESVKNTGVYLSDSEFLEISSAFNTPEMLSKPFSYLPVSPEKIPTMDALVADLKNPFSYFKYRINQKDYLFPFQLKDILPEKVFNNGSQELKYYALEKILNENFNREKKEIVRKLNSKLDKILGTIKQLEIYLGTSKDYETLERDANLLFSQQDAKIKGLSQVTLQNLLSENQEDVTIKLNPTLTLHENAVQIFSRTRNLKEAKSEKTFLLGKKKTEWLSTGKLLEEIQLVEQQNQLKQFKKQNSGMFKETAHQQEISEPFHRVLSKFGYEILIGKHAKGNDFLLSKIAGKNDIWLHTKSSSGSHVIIPNQSKEMPPKPKIEEGAAYAAFFSSQKKSDWVPVTYTFAKYVRKIKGSAPGSVVVDKEEVLFVKPVKP